MEIETWCGYDIRFVEIDGEWWAILKDLCDALKLDTWRASQRIDSRDLMKIRVNNVTPLLCRVTSPKARKTQDMIIINEHGIYRLLADSRRLEARKFQDWMFDIMSTLRKNMGLEGYQVMKMTDPIIQRHINNLLEDLYFDQEEECWMRIVTMPDGDVEAVPFK